MQLNMRLCGPWGGLFLYCVEEKMLGILWQSSGHYTDRAAGL